MASDLRIAAYNVEESTSSNEIRISYTFKHNVKLLQT